MVKPKRQTFESVIFTFMLVITGIYGVFFSLPVFPLLFLNLTLWRRYICIIHTMWFNLVSYMIEHVCGVRYRITSDSSSKIVDPASKHAIVLICNHTTRTDWMFLWPVLCRLGCVSSMRIALKGDLHNLPIFGWYMQLFLFPFLSRDRNKDIPFLRHSCRHLISTLGDSVALVIFPEGTDLSESNVAKSHKYAAAQTPPLPQWQHVLIPKSLGTEAVIEAIRDSSRTSGTASRDGGVTVIDMTIAYTPFPSVYRFKEVDMIRGYWPKEVHVHLRRQLVLPDKPLDLQSVFAAKEKALDYFYSTATDAHSVSRHLMTQKVAERTPSSPVQPQTFGIAFPTLSTEYLCTVAFWCVVIGFISTCLFFAMKLWIILTTLSVIFCAGVTRFLGGFDALEYRIWDPLPESTASAGGARD